MMNQPQFQIERAPRQPINKLEAHLVQIAETWCQQGCAKPIRTLADFKKNIETELAWYCHDHKRAPASSVVIGEYDEELIYIKPYNRDERATATIRVVSQPLDYDPNESYEGAIGPENICRQCGCHPYMACTHPQHGPCWWAEVATSDAGGNFRGPLCSHCAIKLKDVSRPWQTEAA
jgi:hypothetical protein